MAEDTVDLEADEADVLFMPDIGAVLTGTLPPLCQ